MTAKASPAKSSLPRRVLLLHFWLVGLYAIQVVVFDAWGLITTNSILQRWIATGIYLAALLLVLYLARRKVSINKLVWLLICADIGFASFNIYVQRGMSSRAVILYVLPIVVAALLASRASVIAAAVLSMVAYALTAQAYFITHFNEGYKVELYGEVGFYCLYIILLGLLISFVLRPKT